jgi:hypothetical protein
MADYPGVPNVMALAQMNDLQIDEDSGDIAFSVRLTSGAVPLPVNAGLVPRAERWEFSGIIDSQGMRGIMTIIPDHAGLDQSVSEQMKEFSRTSNEFRSLGQGALSSCDTWMRRMKEHEEFLIDAKSE